MSIISIVNWIDKPQAIVKGKEKTSASFIRNPYENPNERRKI